MRMMVIIGICITIGVISIFVSIYNSRTVLLELSWYGVGPDVQKAFTYSEWKTAVKKKPHGMCWTSVMWTQRRYLGDVCRVPGISWWEYRTECDKSAGFICGDSED